MTCELIEKIKASESKEVVLRHKSSENKRSPTFSMYETTNQNPIKQIRGTEPIECIEVLKPFYKVTVNLSGQKYTTISIVQHSCYYLRYKLAEKHEDPIANKFQEILSESFEFYMQKYEVFENSNFTIFVIHPFHLKKSLF
jgi:hypothetical protein